MIFNLKTFEIEKIIEAHISCIREIKLFHNWIITSSNDNSIKIHSKTDFKNLATLLGHTNSIPTFTTFEKIDEKSIISFLLCLKEINKKFKNKSVTSKMLYYIPKMLVIKIVTYTKLKYLVSGSYDNTIRVKKKKNGFFYQKSKINKNFYSYGICKISFACHVGLFIQGSFVQYIMSIINTL